MNQNTDMIIEHKIDSFIKDCKKNKILKEDEQSTTTTQDQQEIKTAPETKETTSEVTPSEENNETNSLGLTLRKNITPEKEAIELVLKSINTAFANSYAGLRKYKQFDEQMKAWQKQVKGTCDSIMNKVKQTGFNSADNTVCSPMAYNILSDSTNRDIDMLELCGACIIFYNSLK